VCISWIFHLELLDWHMELQGEKTIKVIGYIMIVGEKTH